MTQDRFSREVESSGRKLLEARRSRPQVWRYAALLGGGGWLLVVPVVAGAYLGRWLDGRHVGGGQSWTLTLILIGIGIGIYNFWHYYRRGSDG
jgi:ATP synthase protein I